MLQIISVNDNGDYIVSATSEIEKSQMEVLRLAMKECNAIINKAAEVLRECLVPLFHELGRKGKTVEEMLEEIRKIFDSVGDLEEKYRVKKEKCVQISKAYTRGRGKPRGQQGNAIKYKLYELRVYGI